MTTQPITNHNPMVWNSCHEFVQTQLVSLCQKVSDCFFSFLEIVKNLFCCSTPAITSAHSVQTIALTQPLTPEQLDQLRERERGIWQTKMNVNLKLPNRHSCFVDLSGQISEPSRCAAISMDTTPQIVHYEPGNSTCLPQLLTVKLPARQLERFPDALKRELSAYDADHLDLYFIVWQDMPRVLEGAGQAGKRNLVFHSAAFPNAQLGETHNNNMLMGIFGADGIQRAQGNPNQAIVFDQFGLQNVHIHPAGARQAQIMSCVSPDNARFYLPPQQRAVHFYSACKLPNNRAAAFLGVIAPSFSSAQNPVSALIEPLRRQSITLQEYKAGIQTSAIQQSLVNEVTRLLDFQP